MLSSVADLARSGAAAASHTTAELSAGKVEADPLAEAGSATKGAEERRDGKRRADDQAIDGPSEGSESKRLKVEQERQTPETTGALTAVVVKQEDQDNKCTLPDALSVVAALPSSKVDEWTPALSEATTADSTPHRYDIFLSEDFRDRICRCADCLPKWAHLPHVLDAEETYAPPSDPHASVREDDAASISSSTYDLGMAALRTMPREKMINTMHAYSKFRDALWEHLKPFAGTGKMVREEDVRAFFQKKLNAEQ